MPRFYFNVAHLSFPVGDCLGEKSKTITAHGFQYVGWIETARAHKVRFVDWPANIACGCPGPDFYHRGLNIASLEAILTAGARIVPWTDGKSPTAM